MNLYKPFHYFFGEYVFEVGGRDFPRLANILAEKRIYFWRTENRDEKISFRSSVFLAESIATTAKEQDVPLEITEKRGLPFLFSRYRRRYGMIIGFLLGLFLLFFSQLFVWKVTVTGNEKLSVRQIETALSECGIEVGSFIPYIDVLADANRLLLNCEDISSAAININGTHLTLTVLEGSPPPDIVNTSGFYNVVAERDGIILDIDAADGSPEVSEGEAVYKGQLLINSFIEGTNGSFRPTHARGIVYAAVEESFICEIPLNRITKNYTGNTETKRIFHVMGQELRFSSEESPFEYFDAVVTEKDIYLFGFIELPIKIEKIVYSEYTPSARTITAETAELYADSALEDFLFGLDCDILSCETEFTTDEEKGVCLLKANAVIKQDIGKEIPYEIDYYNISERLPNARE